MSTRSSDKDFSDLESRLRAGAPGERDRASISRVRSLISSPQPRRWVARAVVAAVFVAAIGVALALWPSTEGSLQPSPAFAYEEVAQVVVPEDGVLHFKLSCETTPVAPMMVAGEIGATVTVEYPPDTTNVSEVWIDDTHSMYRKESTSGYPAMFTRVVETPDRVLLEDRFPDANQVLFSERLKSDEGPMFSNSELDWLESGWMRSFASAIENRACEVTEDVASDGTDVWRVTWKDKDLGGSDLTCVALFGRLDYRPLSIDVRTEREVTYPEPSVTYTHGEVEVWEILSVDDVPADLFDTRVDLSDTDPSYSIAMTPDDPRIAGIGFPVWKAGDEAGLGAISCVRFRRGFAVTGLRGASFDLEQSGMLTVYHGDFDPWMPNPDVVGITAYASSDPEDIETYWAGQMPQVDEKTGEVDGLSYRMRSSGTTALLLTSINEETVVITGPDEETILSALGALEPYE